MTTTIGRVGRGNITMDGISSWKMSGRRVTLEGVLHANNATNSIMPGDAALAEVLAERQRLMGYVGNFDEPVVPITWDCDSTVEGFYRILGAEVGFNNNSLRTGIFPFTVEAEQVVGYAAPQFEAIITGTSLANVHGITGVSWFTFPQAVTEQFFRNPILGQGCRVNELRTTATGVLNFTDCNELYVGSLLYYLRPADFYIGTCSFKQGDPLELTVGTQILDTPYDWEMSNSLLRVRPSPTQGRLLIAWYDGTQWETEKQFTIVGDEPPNPVMLPLRAGEAKQFNTVSILRNSPEMCVIRLSLGFPDYGIEASRTFMDLSLRRGDRSLRVILQNQPDYFPNKWEIRRSEAEAATLITGAIRATSNDAGGNRYLIMTPGTFTTDLTQGQVSTPSGTALGHFGISMEIGGSSAVDTATAPELVNQFFGSQVERLVVASR